jgi:hypothetical protein
MGKVIAFLVALVVGFFVLMGVASEMGGEVVKLTTNDAQGAQRTTSLWVVDDGGVPYLRAGNSESGWYERLVADPNIEVERDGVVTRYLAQPSPDRTERINALMAEKYGWADAVIGIVRGDSVAVRLAPVD